MASNNSNVGSGSDNFGGDVVANRSGSGPRFVFALYSFVLLLFLICLYTSLIVYSLCTYF